MRTISAFILSLLPFAFASNAEAAVTRFKVLMDSDADVATGCLVQGMPGVDQVFTTDVLTDEAGARVTRTTLSVCSAGIPGPEVEISTGGWPVGFQAESGATLVETSMPFSLFPGGIAPSQIRLGIAASQGAASHVVLARPDGSSVIYPPARRRRRAVVAPGEARVITLDGDGADWNGLDALVDGIAGTGSPSLRMLKFFAFADQQTGTLFFRFDASLSSDAPFATDDVFSRAAGEGLTVPAPGVLANDGDPNDLPLTALPVTPAAHGNVVLNPDGSFTYTPADATSAQTDAFEYRASNGTKSSNPARVEITVSATGPSAPVASNDAWTTNEDEPLVIRAPGVLANDIDANGDPLTSALATPPSHGSVVLHADGGFTYAPQLNYFGSDTFTYAVSDGTASDTAQVTITILSMNDRPAVRSTGFDVPENSGAGTVIGTVYVSDADSGDSHTFAITAGNVDGAFAISRVGTITVANAAALDFETSPQFVLTVRALDDGTPSLSDTGTITITLLDVNDAPVATGQTVVTDEDTPVAITLAASDQDADPFIWTVVAAPLHGALSGTAPNLTYTPVANYFGADGFTFRVNDGTVDSSPATVAITVASVNDAPAAVSDAFVVDEAGSANGDVLANDSDVEGPLTAVLDTNVAHGTLTLNASGTFTYVHDGSETTSDSFTYHATDGAASSAIVTVSITVNPVNDAPVNTVPGPQVTAEDLPLSLSLSIADADAGGALVEVTLTGTNGTVSLSGTAGLTFTAGANSTSAMTFRGTIADINAALASLAFVATPNFSGTASLTITTNDLGNTPAPAASDTDAITITVTAANDAPVAADDAYPVDEGATLNVPAPGVLGNDSDVDSTITAVLVNDVTNGTLTLNADGSFTYVHDGSETTSDSFTYRATDGAADSAEVTVALTINPVNDLPVFTSSNAVSVPENATSALTVTTSDAENDLRTYSITGGADAARFAIAANSGALSFTSAPDFEAPADADGNNIYLVEVTANDGGGTSMQAIAVTVTNVDEAPVASDATFSLDENSADGTVVGSVTAVDPDAGETLTYAITAGNAGGAFAINATSGAITVANVSALDFEVTPSFALTVTVTDDSVGALSDAATITISLNNVNEAPVVNAATVSLDENSANGIAVHTVTFTEPDTTSQTHSFAITAGNDGGGFAIDATSGAITVADVNALDFETTPTFALTVEVTDAGAPTPSLSGSATITINLNDLNENPVVNDQSFSIDENSADGTVVGIVAATDQDAGQTLTYAITADPLAAFSINGTTGRITVANPAALDYETNPTIALTVQVTDSGTGALTDTAVITINLTNVNEAPSITPQGAPATLAENAANGTVVLNVTASDPDAGQTLTYAITTGNTGGAFAIDASGVVTVASSGALDFETNPAFTMTIQVSDNGSPVATDTTAFVINLTNVNEAPVVNALTVSLPENTGNGTMVGTATFSDQDAGQAHTFAITAGNDLGAFAIDASSGAITVADMTDLDFETNPTFSLTVQVTDNLGLTGSNTITVNLTDANEAPVVNDQAFNVDENSAIDTVVGTITFTDLDGPGATFSITAGNTGGEFAVNAATGQITVAKLLDYETPPTSFAFTIEIADGGAPAGSDTAQITINVNNVNEAPVVDAATVAIDENTPNGTSVATVTFTEPDGGQSHGFTITGGNTGSAFAINASTGEITVANAAAVNFEATPAFALTVQVTDNGTPAASGTATITVNLNDLNDAPLASDATFGVMETAAIGAAVGTVAATDEDGGQTLTYSIAGGNTGSAFAINASTGQITVAAPLDYETLASYALTVQVQDSGTGPLSDTATITINVTNVNEPPVAGDNTFAIDEDVSAPFAITTVSASDPDGDALTFAIVSGNEAGVFDINPTSGAIVMVGDLDFETTPSHTLHVSVTDPGLASTVAVISIQVNNVNEAPVVAPATFTIAENTASGTDVGTPITFTEPDGAGQTHTYSIASGNTGNAFAIDANGQITVATASAVNVEITPTFTLTVNVSDNGTPPQIGGATVTINLTDVNDAPVLSDTMRSVAENAGAATDVGLPVTAVDEDVPAQNLTYSILSGNTGGAFAINASTGQITVAGALDYEGADDPYTLVVQVQDNGTPALSDTANVTITIIDVNEAPVLEDAARSIAENSVNGTAVGAALMFSDPDVGQTHVFAITAGNTDGVFAINDSGQIAVADVTKLNYETTQSYALTVQITDGGGPALSDIATVTIEVIDVNEAPIAGTDAYVYIANTELRIGGHAGNVTAVASTANATKLIANDTDPDTLNAAFRTLSITPASGTTVKGSSYSIAADGSMVYTPGPGLIELESIDYSLTDGTNTVTGTINFTRDGTDRVWYVKNNATAPGTGTSTAPFTTLVGAQNASADNDIIYVLAGDGTTTGQNAGFVLKNSQKLWGNGVPLIVDRTTDPDLQLIAAGSQPQIGNSSGIGVSATNLTGVFEVRGLNVGATADAILITSNGANTVISNNTIRSAGNEGIEIAAATGAPVLSISDNVVTANGTGISVTGAAPKTMRAFANNTVTGNTAGSGIVIANATFDSDAVAGLQAVAGGTIQVGVFGNPVGLGGMALTNVAGTLNLGDLAIYNANGGGLAASGTVTGFKLTVDSGGAARNIESTGGPALDLTGIEAALPLAMVKSTNSTTTGVSLANVAGTVSAGSGSAISNATGTDFAISGGTADVTYNGTITDDVGQLVSISGATAGTKTFSGAITDGDDGDGSGIALSSNTGATIRFNGGLLLSTGSNAAFAAAGGGTVEVCDEAGCDVSATGLLVNKITTTSGTALNVASTAIGAGGLEFKSISVNGAANGIMLSGTGSAGGLKVVGTSTTDGTGGTIQNISGRGASFINAAKITLKNMNFTNVATAVGSPCGSAAAAGANGGCNAALHFDTVNTAVLDNLNLTTSGQQGINAVNLTGLTLANSVLSNLGNGPDEDGLHFHNLLGANSISNTSITSSGDDNVNIQNLSGTSTITIAGGSFNTGVLGSGLLFGIRDTANTTISISNVTADNNFSGGIVADASGLAVMKVTVDTATLTNNNDGVSMSSANGSTKFNVKNSTFTGNDFAAMSFLKAADSTAGLFEGRIENNNITIGNGRMADAISVFQAGGGSLVSLITGNTIDYAGTQRAILIQAGQDGNGSLDATVTSNNIDVKLDGAGDAVAGVLAQSSVVSTSTSPMCLDFGGASTLKNVVTHSAGGSIVDGDLRVRQRNNATVRLPGYGGAATDLNAVVNYLSARNTFVQTPTATATPTGFSGGAFPCTQPTL